MALPPTLAAAGIHAATLICLASAPAAAVAAPDPNDLIRGLARDAPSTISFAEARFSALLVEPIVVSGELGYFGPGNLDREVTSPFRERTEIRGQSVRVTRDGESPRTFALRRAPELGELLSSFAGLLSGDAAAVSLTFSVVAHGSDEAWALELAPLDAGERRRLQQILVGGAHNEVRCFAMLGADGAASVMLLGADAASRLADEATLEALLEQCRAE